MFIAHYGVALGAKLASPRASLGTLILATAFIDLLWPAFLLAGIEKVRIAPGITTVTPLDFVHYPYSHSLLAVLLWGGLLGIAYLWRTGNRRGAATVAALVVSHWLLDAVAHRPDLPLYPGSAYHAGLGLWFSVPGTLAVELGIFTLGLVIYWRATRATSRTGNIALAALTALLLVIYAGNFTAPPPPGERALAWVGQAQWLFVLWGYWLDKNRSFIDRHVRSSNAGLRLQNGNERARL